MTDTNYDPIPSDPAIHHQESMHLEEHNHDEIVPFVTSPTATKLTNTAVFLHDNNNRIEHEMRFLKDQIQTLKEVDEILENVKKLISSVSIMKSKASERKKSIHRQNSFTVTDTSTSISISSSCAVWDEANSSTTVVHNFF
jgi:hypothetical protein